MGRMARRHPTKATTIRRMTITKTVGIRRDGNSRVDVLAELDRRNLLSLRDLSCWRTAQTEPRRNGDQDGDRQYDHEEDPEKRP